jgi:hypothetical protein
MRTLDFMLLAPLDSACHSTDWVSIGSSEHEVGRRKHKFYSGVRPIAWTNSSCACE